MFCVTIFIHDQYFDLQKNIASIDCFDPPQN